MRSVMNHTHVVYQSLSVQWWSSGCVWDLHCPPAEHSALHLTSPCSLYRKYIKQMTLIHIYCAIVRYILWWFMVHLSSGGLVLVRIPTRSHTPRPRQSDRRSFFTSYDIIKQDNAWISSFLADCCGFWLAIAVGWTILLQFNYKTYNVIHIYNM